MRNLSLARRVRALTITLNRRYKIGAGGVHATKRGYVYFNAEISGAVKELPDGRIYEYVEVIPEEGINSYTYAAPVIYANWAAYRTALLGTFNYINSL